MELYIETVMQNKLQFPDKLNKISDESKDFII